MPLLLLMLVFGMATGGAAFTLITRHPAPR
jgi:hypothetical protein